MDRETTVLVMYSNLAVTPRHRESLQRIAAPKEVTVADLEDQAVELAPSAEVFLGHRYFRQCLPHAPALRWVQSTAAGVDALVTPGLLERDVAVSRCPIFAGNVARHALAMSLALQRRLPDNARSLPSASFPPTPERAVVLGTGAIGTALAGLLTALGIRVTGIARRPHPELVPPFDAVLVGAGWRHALEDADLCFLTLPNTRETRGLFDVAAVDALPDYAVLVNVGREQTLDDVGAIQRLREGRLGGMGLDVISEKARGIAATDDMPGLLVTPKTATFAAGRDEQLRHFVEQQLQLYCAGREPAHVLPRETLAQMVPGT